tara:strand:+ start:35 stop:196 length:162 start_codon:yes stop_codon:yes gene_type:complete
MIIIICIIGNQGINLLKKLKEVNELMAIKTIGGKNKRIKNVNTNNHAWKTLYE